jgi:hypothetical protein
VTGSRLPGIVVQDDPLTGIMRCALSDRMIIYDGYYAMSTFPREVP